MAARSFVKGLPPANLSVLKSELSQELSKLREISGEIAKIPTEKNSNEGSIVWLISNGLDAIIESLVGAINRSASGYRYGAMTYTAFSSLDNAAVEFHNLFIITKEKEPKPEFVDMLAPKLREASGILENLGEILQKEYPNTVLGLLERSNWPKQKADRTKGRLFMVARQYSRAFYDMFGIYAIDLANRIDAKARAGDAQRETIRSLLDSARRRTGLAYIHSEDSLYRGLLRVNEQEALPEDELIELVTDYGKMKDRFAEEPACADACGR